MRGCSFNTDLPSSATNLGAVQSRPRRRGRAATEEKLATKEKLATQGKSSHRGKSYIATKEKFATKEQLATKENLATKEKLTTQGKAPESSFPAAGRGTFLHCCKMLQDNLPFLPLPAVSKLVAMQCQYIRYSTTQCFRCTSIDRRALRQRRIAPHCIDSLIQSLSQGTLLIEACFL